MNSNPTNGARSSQPDAIKTSRAGTNSGVYRGATLSLLAVRNRSLTNIEKLSSASHPGTSRKHTLYMSFSINNILSRQTNSQTDPPGAQTMFKQYKHPSLSIESFSNTISIKVLPNKLPNYNHIEIF